ncbi:hypothetical protein [Mesorhizobium sp.]|uniref:hypothetical protein n=1 Tax=Mesorhizobium sp. TaxID=1871066 RepID=UPI0025EC9863|nr:hypothetical protein [Mesorhizobium sp.]
MPKHRKPPRRSHSEPRPARRRKDPRLTVGDIIFLLQPETWAAIGAGKRVGAMAAALVVLAATARIGTKRARDILLADWNAGNVVVSAPTGPRTAILLEIAIAVVQRYIELRPKNAGPWLFVSDEGRKLYHGSIKAPFAALGRRCGIPGTTIPTRCLEFFHRSFDGEDDDRAAVVALCGQRDRAVDLEVHREHVEDAARDHDRLRAVLKDNHALEGPAGRFLRAPGMTLAAATQRLRISQDRPATAASPAMSTDPVCIALSQVAWPEFRKTELRMELKQLHFDRIYDLRRAGLIRRSEAAYLFSCATTTMANWERDRKMTEKTPERRAEEAYWTEKAPTMFATRRRGQTPAQFHDLLVNEHRCTLPMVQMFAILHRAGVLHGGPRPR